MSFFQKIAAVWQKVSLVQRALLVAIVLAFVVIGMLLTNWARRPDMRMLYQGLSPEEASKITEKISENNIAYELRGGGTTIYVPKEKVYQLRLDMAREGLATGEQGGFKIFDKEKIGVSPFVQNVNLQRALQEELAKSIQMVDGIVHARVHIVTPEQTLFSSEAGRTTASVVLRLKPGYKVSALNIAAITNLVSGSVEGLATENVTVIDSQGRLLSSKSDQTMASGARTVQDYRERVEQNLSNKAEEMLETVLGPGRASVRVSAVIDMNSVSLITETLDPTGKVTLKEEITSGSETEPGPASETGLPPASGGVKKDETIITEYEVGKITKQEVILPGQIKSLSVAAFVDLSTADANETTSAGGSPMIMQLADVEQVIRNAIGLKETDSLKVVNVKFHRPDVASMIEQEPSSWPLIMTIVRHASLGIMAICALLVLRIFRGAKAKAASAAAPAGQLTGAEGSTGFLPAEAGASESVVLRRQISNALQRNPDQVKQVFSSWLQDSGG